MHFESRTFSNHNISVGLVVSYNKIHQWNWAKNTASATADQEISNKIVFCMKAFHYILLVRRKINCCDYGLVYSLPLVFVVVVGSFM